MQDYHFNFGDIPIMIKIAKTSTINHFHKQIATYGFGKHHTSVNFENGFDSRHHLPICSAPGYSSTEEDYCFEKWALLASVRSLSSLGSHIHLKLRFGVYSMPTQFT